MAFLQHGPGGEGLTIPERSGIPLGSLQFGCRNKPEDLLEGKMISHWLKVQCGPIFFFFSQKFPTTVFFFPLPKCDRFDYLLETVFSYHKRSFGI